MAHEYSLICDENPRRSVLFFILSRQREGRRESHRKHSIYPDLTTQSKNNHSNNFETIILFIPDVSM